MQSSAKRPFERMRNKFVKVMMTITSALDKKIAEGKTDLDKVKTWLSIRYPDHEKQLSDAQSVDELLKTIHRDCFFTNPDPLEALADLFDLQEEEQEVEQYRNDLENYYQEVLAEDFIQQGVEEYNKNTNIEVSRVDWKQGH